MLGDLAESDLLFSHVRAIFAFELRSDLAN